LKKSEKLNVEGVEIKCHDTWFDWISFWSL